MGKTQSEVVASPSRESIEVRRVRSDPSGLPARVRALQRAPDRSSVLAGGLVHSILDHGLVSSILGKGLVSESGPDAAESGGDSGSTCEGGREGDSGSACEDDADLLISDALVAVGARPGVT